MSNNFWGPPDDIEPLPDWMNPETYRNPQNTPFKKSTKSLFETINEAVKKPPVDLSYLEKNQSN